MIKFKINNQVQPIKILISEDSGIQAGLNLKIVVGIEDRRMI